MKLNKACSTGKGWSCDILSQQRTVLMGIAILMIVFFHFTEDCMVYEVHYTGFIKWYKTYIGSSSVDMFFFLSGLGLYYSMKKNPDIPAFYKRRLAKVLLPYAIIALPAWYLYDMVLDNEGLIRLIQDFTFVTFFTDGVRRFWYIGAVLAGYFIYPAVFYLVDRLRNRAAEWGIFLFLCVALTIAAQHLLCTDKELFEDINIVLLRIPAFLAGCFYGRASYEKRRGYWLWAVLAVISIAMATQISDNSAMIYDRYVMAAVNISVCACAAILIGKVRQGNGIIRIISWFGTHSLELYLTHVAIRRIMAEMECLTCYCTYELIMLVLAIISAWFLQRLTNWICRWRKQNR